jgi:hypothetical protein
VTKTEPLDIRSALTICGDKPHWIHSKLLVHAALVLKSEGYRTTPESGLDAEA